LLSFLVYFDEHFVYIWQRTDWMVTFQLNS